MTQMLITLALVNGNKNAFGFVVCSVVLEMEPRVIHVLGK